MEREGSNDDIFKTEDSFCTRGSVVVVAVGDSGGVVRGEVVPDKGNMKELSTRGLLGLNKNVSKAVRSVFLVGDCCRSFEPLNEASVL